MDALVIYLSHWHRIGRDISGCTITAMHQVFDQGSKRMILVT